MDKYEARVLKRQLADFVWEWDPIGVADVREDASDEYDCIVDPLVGKLVRGESAADIVAFLTDRLENHFGMLAAPLDPQAFAAKVVTWYRERERRGR